MLRYFDLARMTVAGVPGTGPITLGAAMPGFLSFAAAGVGNGDTVRLAIRDGDTREVSLGTYNNGVVTRTLNKSTSGSLLNLSADAIVSIVAAALDFFPQDSDATTFIEIVDAGGLVGGQWTAALDFSVLDARIDVLEAFFTGDASPAYIEVVDAHGLVGAYWDDEGVHPGSDVSDGYSVAEIAGRDGAAAAMSVQASKEVPNASLVPRPFIVGINHIIVDGQSFANGFWGFPPKSIAQSLDNLMLGDSVYSHDDLSPSWVQIGAAAFNPLVANVVDALGNIVAAATYQTWTNVTTDPAAHSRGENYGIGMANTLKALWLRSQFLTADATRQFLVTGVGVSGTLIEDFVATYYTKARQCIDLAKATATAAGKAIELTAYIMDQGQSNSVAGTAKATYKANFLSYITGQLAYAMTQYGQTAKPLVFIVATGESYARDNQDIVMAQRELCDEQGWVFIGPSYHVTDRGGHLSPNGYRWIGNKLGQIAYEVLFKQRQFQYLRPLAITMRGTQILVTFKTQYLPIAFRDVYVGTTPTTYANKGFSAADDAGVIPISAVDIVGDATIRITTGRAAATNPYLRLGDQTTYLGNANVADSDPSIGWDVYDFSTTGPKAENAAFNAENIPALVGLPYPAFNFSPGFKLPIVLD
jgi:hypothetical protein